MGLDFAFNQLGIFAYGSVVGLTGASVPAPAKPFPGGGGPLNRGVVSAKLVNGVYTLTSGLFRPASLVPPASVSTFVSPAGGIDARECIVLVSLRGIGFDGGILLEHTSPSVKTVRTFNDVGQPTDRDFDFLIAFNLLGRAGTPLPPDVTVTP